MLNIAKSLDHLGINSGSYIGAVAGVREAIEEGRTTDEALLSSVFNLDDVNYGDILVSVRPDVGRLMIVQNMVDVAVRNGCQVDNPAELFEQAKKRALAFMADPAKAWMLVESTTPAQKAYAVRKSAAGGSSAPDTTVVGESGVAVKLNGDGKIKKGGKGPAAEALYTKFVLQATEPLNNAGFVELLMKELQMSKAGARTYAYNCRTALGEPVKK